MNGYRRRENTLDCGDIYKALRGDFVGLIGNATTGQLDTLVAATPEWRVRDVLAHVAGLTEDLNAGNFGVGDPDAFTRTQVDRHRDSSLDEVIAAWAREAPAFEDGLRLLGYQIGNHFLGDLFIHFVDVCSALDRRVDRASTAMWVSLDWYLDSLEEALVELNLGALEVVTEPERRIVGHGDAVATVTAPAFEILRACAGRRSTAQIAGFSWTGDAARFLPHLSRYSFPDEDLHD